MFTFQPLAGSWVKLALATSSPRTFDLSSLYFFSAPPSRPHATTTWLTSLIEPGSRPSSCEQVMVGTLYWMSAGRTATSSALSSLNPPSSAMVCSSTEQGSWICDSAYWYSGPSLAITFARFSSSEGFSGVADALGLAAADPLGAGVALAVGVGVADGFALGVALPLGAADALALADADSDGSGVGLALTLSVLPITWRNRSTAGSTSLRSSSSLAPPATLTTMVLSPSTTTSGSDTPEKSTRSAIVCRACAIFSRSGVRWFGRFADRIMLVPPCRSRPSFGLAFLSPVKKTRA